MEVIPLMARSMVRKSNANKFKMQIFVTSFEFFSLRSRAFRFCRDLFAHQLASLWLWRKKSILPNLSRHLTKERINDLIKKDTKT
jgi:hypothetical protein